MQTGQLSDGEGRENILSGEESGSLGTDRKNMYSCCMIIGLQDYGITYSSFSPHLSICNPVQTNINFLSMYWSSNHPRSIH